MGVTRISDVNLTIVWRSRTVFINNARWARVRGEHNREGHRREEKREERRRPVDDHKRPEDHKRP
jgi:hypothetical protein